MKTEVIAIIAVSVVAFIAFVILLIVSRKFRSYIQLKVLGSKFGPTYEKIIVKIIILQLHILWC